MAWNSLPEPEATVCELCGRDASGGTLCEECRVYLKIFENKSQIAIDITVHKV